MAASSDLLGVLNRYVAELFGPAQTQAVSPVQPEVVYGVPKISSPRPAPTRVASTLPKIGEPARTVPALPKIGGGPGTGMTPVTLPPIQGMIEGPDQGMVPLSAGNPGTNDAYFASVLSKAGLPATPQNLSFLNAWAQREGVPQSIDRYNLLGTTLPFGGSYGTNAPGVQSYPSQEAGTSALAKMFGQSNFSAIRNALASGDIYGQRNNPELQAAFKLWSGGGYSFPVSGGYSPTQPTKPTEPLTPFAGQVKFTGPTQGLDQSFSEKVSAAVRAVGGTGIRITSGYRSPEHNKAIGGATRSNHMFGHAIDGYVTFPNGKEVPIGTALAGIVGQFGLRSGANDPTFFRGARDPIHVDDGFNQ